MATRGDLIDRIIQELHLETASYTAQVINAINSAVDFYRGERFWFTEGTTSLTLLTASTITLSSDLPDSVTIDNVRGILELASGVIIGTHFKVDGNTWNPVDGARVRRFMDLVETLR